jgi:arylsulfatase A-like enzyme
MLVRFLLAVALLCALAASTSCGGARPVNLLLIVIDTVRADRLGSYGYARPTTPGLDALARRGLRFENVASTSSWTVPAHSSMFTGLPPIVHGATQEHNLLDERYATLAEVLRERGYATFGVSDNPLVSSKTGLARGFDTFVESWRERDKDAPRPSAGEHPNLRNARALLDKLDGERPFFLCVNYMEAHARYDPPEPYRSQFLLAEPSPEDAELVTSQRFPRFYLDRPAFNSAVMTAIGNLYDGEIAYLDTLVSGFVEDLERAGHLDNAAVFVMSDHGESLGEHDHFRHAFQLYRESVRVPLIALLPDGARAGEVERKPASVVDLFATLLGLAGASPPAGQDAGRNLLAQAGPADDAPQFSEYYYPVQALGRFKLGPNASAALGSYWRRLRAVEHAGMRLIHSSAGPSQLFDLRRDPGEEVDLAGDPAWSEELQRLTSLLEAYVAAAGGEPPAPARMLEQDVVLPAFEGLDTDEVRRLRELGYIR